MLKIGTRPQKNPTSRGGSLSTVSGFFPPSCCHWLLNQKAAMVYNFNMQWKKFKLDIKVDRGDYWARSIITKVYCENSCFLKLFTYFNFPQ